MGKIRTNAVQFGKSYQRGAPFSQLLTIEDVQMTKDDVPIIYHDFLMSETGTDAPLHNISFDQVISSPSQRAIDSR